MLIYATRIAMKQFFLFLLFCFPAFGRLGETKAECVKRYGKPVFIDGNVVHHVKNGFVVSIQFVDDNACFLSFNHTDEMAEISKTERDEIVKANAGNRRIVDITNEHNAALKPEYAEVLFFIIQKNDKVLVITDAISWKKISEQVEAKEKENVKGF